MHAPRNPGRRFQEPEDSRPQRDTDQPSERTLPDLLADQPRPLDPAESPGCGPAHPPVPSTPGELVAMQRMGPEERLAELLVLLRARDLTPWDSQQIALNLLQQLEAYHHGVLAEMQDTPDSTAAQVACWAIDGDRLMHCRRLLESITLI